MKNKILKITLLNHLSSFKWMFFLALIYYSIAYFLLEDLFTGSLSITLVLHIWVLLQFIIVFYIHITYYIENRNKSFRIERNYIFDKKNNNKIENIQIEKIFVHKSYSLTSGRIAFFPFQHYRYCEIVLKDKRKIILTSLLKHNIDEYLKENLKGVLFENNFLPFCFFL